MFVLLAGYGAGLAYGGTLNRQGYLYAAADTLKRAWTLYIAHIFLFVVFTAQVAYSATLLDRAYYLDEARLDVLGECALPRDAGGAAAAVPAQPAEHPAALRDAAAVLRADAVAAALAPLCCWGFPSPSIWWCVSPG